MYQPYLVKQSNACEVILMQNKSNEYSGFNPYSNAFLINPYVTLVTRVNNAKPYRSEFKIPD